MTFFTNIDSTGKMISVNLDNVIGILWTEKYVAFNTMQGAIKFNIEDHPHVLEEAQHAVGILKEKELEDGEE